MTLLQVSLIKYINNDSLISVKVSNFAKFTSIENAQR